MRLWTPRQEQHSCDRAHWGVMAICEKFETEAFERGGKPYEVLERPGNLLLNAGITRLLSLLIGGGGQAYDTTPHARIGVGDSTTAAVATQTDLQASSNKYYMTMDNSFPSVSGQSVTFKATFGSGVANFPWQEWGVDNGTVANTGPGVAPMLNRKVESLGTKTSGGTWILTVTITIS